MQKRIKSHKRNSFWAFLLSDVLLILLVLLTLTPFIYNTFQSANERLEDTLSTTIIHTTDNLDSMLSNLENMLLTSSNDAFLAMASITGTASDSDYYKMHRASLHLNSYITANPNLLDILVAYQGNNIILRANSGFDSKETFDMYYATPGLYDAFFAFEKGAYFVPDFRLTHGSPQRNDQVFGYSFPISKYGRGRACLLIHSDAYLNPSVLQAIGDGGFLVLTDYSGRPVLTQGLPEDTSLDSPQMEAFLKRAISIQYTSASGKFTVLAAAPRLLTSNALYGVILRLSLCIIAALLVGISIAAINAYRHSRPVKQMLEELGQYGRHMEGTRNEIQTLQGMLHRLIHENHDFEKQLIAYRQTQHENIITRLFTASNFSKEDIALFDRIIGPLPDRYVIAYGSLENLPLKDDYRDEMSLLILDYLKERLPEDSIYYAPAPLSIAVLINDDTDMERLQVAGEAANIQWSYSQVFSGVENIARALEEARMVRRWGSVAHNTVTLADFQHLYQHIIAGNTQRACEQVATLFAEANVDNARYYYESARFVLYLAAQSTQLPAAAPPFDKYATFATLRDRLDETIAAFCGALNAEKKSHNELLKDQVLTYMQKNFADSNLYAGIIAEQVGISEKYLYNFVKEQTGCSVGEYLQQLRMNSAAEILRSQEVPVNRIYALVGFNSENSFYKAFKRTFGVSPSQYRQSNQ